MFRPHHRHIKGAIALALALGLYAAPVAWADPPPLAKVEAAIGATHSQNKPVVRPNPDEQFPWNRSQSRGVVRQANPAVRPNPDEQIVWNRAQTPATVRVFIPDISCRPHARERRANGVN